MKRNLLQKRNWAVTLMVIGLISFSTVKSQSLDTVISFIDSPILEDHVVYVKIKPLNTDETGKIDCLYTLSQDTLRAWSDLACGVRFKNVTDRDGNTFIEAFDGSGSGYTVSTLEYTLEEPVYIWLEISVPTQTFNVYASYDSLAPEMIVELFGFRNTSTEYIDHMGVHVNPSQTTIQNSATILNYGFVDAVGEFPGIIEAVKDIAKNNTLKGAFPNPVTSTSLLKYNLANASDVNIGVYNTSGTLVKNMYQGFLSPGEHQLTINRNDFVPGVYLCKITTNKTSELCKIIVK